MNPKYRKIGSTEIRLIEELSELIQVICKAKRFGWFNCHPLNPLRTNWQHAQDEMVDIQRNWDELKKEFE